MHSVALTLPNANLIVSTFPVSHFETGDRFIEYIIEKTGDASLLKKLRLLRKRRTSILTKVLKKIFHYDFNYKTKLLMLIKGFKKQEIESFSKSYYNDEIKNNKIDNTNALLLEYRRKGYKIVILSAGYYSYIKFYAEDNKIDDVIANEFYYDDNQMFVGKIKGKDCYGEEKKNAFKSKYSSYSNLVFVSDSMSDYPMFKIADVKYFVSKNDVKLPSDWSVIKWD